MNREDVIRMAREAGFEQNSLGMTYTSGSLPKLLERFAALVATAEREACAKICEIETSVIVTNASEEYQEGRSMGATICCNMILKRNTHND